MTLAAGNASRDGPSHEVPGNRKSRVPVLSNSRVAVQIMSEVPGLQHQAVQSALNVLQENGHVYTASDEYHYRSTIY